VNKKVYLVIVGPLPPPFGGVSISVGNYYKSLKNEGVDVINIPSNKVYQLLFLRPKYIHFNFSIPIKRFLGSLIGRFKNAKVVHTIHGNEFNTKNIFNALTVVLSHKIFFLNSLVAKKCEIFVKSKSDLITPILTINYPLPDKYSPLINKNEKYLYMLVYANSKASINGTEVYGITFILGLLQEINTLRFKVVIVDPSRGYELEVETASKRHNIDLIYIKHPVDFKRLLQEIDLYVRPTSSDGQSVAVLESLALGINTLASDVVPRPPGVCTYKFNCRKDFLLKLKIAHGTKAIQPELTSVKKYIDLLEKE